MTVADFSGVHQAISMSEYESILSKRSAAGANAFWISHSMGGYPQLSLLVKDDIATLNYVPQEFDAGLRSVGKVQSLNTSEVLTFPISESGESVSVPDDAVIPFRDALTAAKEFFHSTKLPVSVEWLQL